MKVLGSWTKKCLNEASGLSNYEKMRLFNAGQRRENIKACGDQKLWDFRRICQNFNFNIALNQIEDEMIRRGLITARTGQQPQPAPQSAAQPQPQPAPYVQPQKTPAEIFLDDFTTKESPKGFVIPTGEADWQAIVEAKKTGDLQSALKVSGGPNLGIYFLIRRFVIAALLGYPEIQEAIKKVLVEKGFDRQIIKVVISHIIANKDKFKDLLDKYKAMKVESLKEILTEDDEAADEAEENKFDKYIPTAADFRKVYEAKKDFEENGDDCNLAHNPYRLPALLLKSEDDGPIIRRFIASALLKWDLLTEQLKAKIITKLKKNKEDISAIMKAVIAKKSAFLNDFITYSNLIQKIKKEDFGSPAAEIDSILMGLADSFNEALDPWNVLAFNINNKKGIYLDPITKNRNKTAELLINGEEADISDKETVKKDIETYFGAVKEPNKIAIDEKDLEEDVEKHDKLNPKLFDNNKLKPEVREKCLEIVDAFAEKFKDVEVAFNIKDIILTGSNASYNYTKDSDIDLHILADTTGLEDPNKLYPVIYDAYKSIFNSKMDISIYGIPVEIYVETEDSARVSNGVYSVKNDAWVKEPVETIIPEIDWDEFMKAYKPWEDEYKKIVKEAEGEKSIDDTPIDDFITKLYELRQQGLQNGGEYSFENLIFKELRNRGHLDRLKDLKNKIIANRLSLKSLDEAYLDDEHLFFDCKTAEIADDEYIDTKKGSNFSAQDLLDGSSDKAYENLESKIEQVTPKQYFAMCGRIQHQPAEELISQVKDDKDKLEHLVQVIKVYNKKFPTPYVNFVPNTEPEGQEGKHRMYVLGELFGWDTPFPVQVIRAKK